VTPPPLDDGEVLLALRGVTVRRDGRPILDSVDWEVRRGERWVILGPNGSGKTTLLAVAGGRLWPTAGTVEILGSRLGTVDLRALRSRVAFVSAAVAKELRPAQRVREVVASGKFEALETWWHHYADADWVEADRLLGATEVASLGERPFGVVSEGERQHVLLARALMGQPELLLLDEPAAGLDMGARERLLGVLASLARNPDGAPIVLVTHHTEEIPEGITHAVLVRDGRIDRAGAAEEILTSDAVSRCFSVPVVVRHEGARWWSQATTAP
jgi:iron complex transport system ATP-binding protein